MLKFHSAHPLRTNESHAAQGPHTSLHSVIVPVYRGAPFLRDLVQALERVRDDWEVEFAPLALAEVIFVDDASVDESFDESFEILSELTVQHPWVRVIQLSRNFGQHPATIAGILHTSGDWVCTLDEDLQHPPESLPAILEHAVTQSCDVVYAQPLKAVHESALRDMGSRLFKSLNSTLSGNPHVRKFNSFRVIRGNVARAAASVSSAETYYDIALCWFTNRVGHMPLIMKDRRFIEHKQSGYNLFGLLRHARRMLFSSKIDVLRLGAAVGFIALLGAVGMSAYVLICKLFFPEVIQAKGWTSLSLMVLFFGGLSSFMLGIALEYILIILMKTQGQPTFLVIDRNQDQVLQNWFRQRSLR